MYAEIAPVNRVRKVAGMRALGALPKAAIPKRASRMFKKNRLECKYRIVCLQSDVNDSNEA